MNKHPQWVAYVTIVRRETHRFLRIWPQTLMPPVITQTLYFLIFGEFIGRRLGTVHGVDYMTFLVPGLVMMSVINNSFANVASSFFSLKFQRSVEEMLVAPVKAEVIVAGFVTGGVLRGLLTGVLVLGVGMLFTSLEIAHPFWALVVACLTAVSLSLAGFINALVAKKFDDIAIFPNFILIPLTYLGGVFYSLEQLPSFWQQISRYNPILYLINGFRYAFLGVSDVGLITALGFSSLLCVVLSVLAVWALRKGVGLKA